MIEAARLAIRQMPEPAFRSVLTRALLLTVALFGGVGVAAWLAWPSEGFTSIEWINNALDWVAGAAVTIAFSFLLFPVASLFAGIFLDDIADAVEERHYPSEKATREQPLSETIVTALQFTGVLIVLNIIFLPVYLFFPIVLYVLNGYLIGREYFEMVAVRYMMPNEAASMRKANRVKVFLAGLLVSLPLSIPIINLLVPLFGTAFMVHVYKDIDKTGNKPLATPAGS
ncbi:MAG: EI24 domain-containing protein [Alphaproteobacteria bacterium]